MAMAVPDMIKTTLSTFVQNVAVVIEEDRKYRGGSNNGIGAPLALLASGSSNGSDLAGTMGNGASTSPGANGTDSEDTAGAEDEYEWIKREHMIAVSVMLTCFSIFGVLGNGLVLYVFSRKSDRVTSTIFILALAWTDFFTCLVIMPFTVTNLQLGDHLTYNGFCKLFHFVITFGVPLSVFIMVAIAVDRYFSICHPFSHMITPKRAKISILCLLIFAIILGLITSCMYSTYWTMNVNVTAEWCLNGTLDVLPLSSSTNGSSTYRTAILASSYSTPTEMVISPSPITTQPTQRSLYANSLMEIIVNQSGIEPAHESSETRAMRAANCTQTVQKMVYAGGRCVETESIFTFWFMNIYQKIFISFFFISLLSVFMLYFFIYRSVAQRRKWRRRQKSCTHSPMKMTNAGVTHDDAGVTPDKVAALNNRGSIRSTIDNGAGQSAPKESYSLQPWSQCNTAVTSAATTSTTELSGEPEAVKLVVTPSSQSNNNGKLESPRPQTQTGSLAAGSGEIIDTAPMDESTPGSKTQNNQNHGDSGNQEAQNAEKSPAAGGGGDAHENSVGKRLTLNIPSPQASAADKKSSRERRDFNFLANIRTAMMLFVVTLVFTACFVPAWLMAAQILTYQPIIFYSHFLYNVANPVIYAFMNQSFRKELKRVFQRGTHLFRAW